MLARTRRRRADRRISHLIHCSISIIIIIIINNHQLPLHHKKRSTSVYIWPMHSGSLSTAELVSKEKKTHNATATLLLPVFVQPGFSRVTLGWTISAKRKPLKIIAAGFSNMPFLPPKNWCQKH